MFLVLPNRYLNRACGLGLSILGGATAAAGPVVSPAILHGSGITSGVNAGYGDRIGEKSTLAVSSNETGTVTFVLTPANGAAIDRHNAVVIYIDSTDGKTGFSDTATLADTASAGNTDEIREAVSGYDGTDRAVLTFAPGFKASHAIAFESAFGSLYRLSNPASFDFISSKNPAVNAIGNVYTLTINMSELGLSSTGSFRYVVTYLDPTAASRSNEYQGVSAVTGATLKNGRDPVKLAAGDFNTFSAALAGKK